VGGIGPHRAGPESNKPIKSKETTDR
jgi:hypothetical protein